MDFNHKKNNTLKFVLVTHKLTIFRDSILLLAVYHATIEADPNYKTASPESLLKKYPVSEAFTNELCAGIVDKSKPLIEIAREEILEECGYNVPVDRIELVMTYR